MPAPPTTPDPVAAARAFVGNPAHYRDRCGAEFDELLATSWAILRHARAEANPAHCTVTVVPRAIFEAHSRKTPILRRLPATPEDAA